MGFASPSSQPKSRSGKPNRPKRSADAADGLAAQPRDYPITDSFGSSAIPSFATRRANTNNKSGFNCTPAKPPGSKRLAQRPGDPPHDRGKVVGRDESSQDANSHGSGGTQK